MIYRKMCQMFLNGLNIEQDARRTGDVSPPYQRFGVPSCYLKKLWYGQVDSIWSCPEEMRYNICDTCNRYINGKMLTYYLWAGYMPPSQDLLVVSLTDSLAECHDFFCYAMLLSTCKCILSQFFSRKISITEHQWTQIRTNRQNLTLVFCINCPLHLNIPSSTHIVTDSPYYPSFLFYSLHIHLSLNFYTSRTISAFHISCCKLSCIIFIHVISCVYLHFFSPLCIDDIDLSTRYPTFYLSMNHFHLFFALFVRERNNVI